jgi:hypothetical protein
MHSVHRAMSARGIRRASIRSKFTIKSNATLSTNKASAIITFSFIGAKIQINQKLREKNQKKMSDKAKNISLCTRN